MVLVRVRRRVCAPVAAHRRRRSALDDLITTEALLADLEIGTATDGGVVVSDPFAADMPPPPMVSLTGDPRRTDEDIEAMLAALGQVDSGGKYVPAYESGAAARRSSSTGSAASFALPEEVQPDPGNVHLDIERESLLMTR